MDRRDFAAALSALLAAATAPTRAQSPAKPTVGYLRSTSAAGFEHLVKAFRDGLAAGGFVEGRDVNVEYRWADNRPERLGALAADLVKLNVDVIVGNSIAADAARAATTRIPIVFVTADDPVRRGLVQSLGRPGGNLTGVTFFGAGALEAKRFELLRDLVPRAQVFGLLVDPAWPTARDQTAEARRAAAAAGKRLVVVEARGAETFEAAFAALAKDKAEALIVGGSPRFTSFRRELIALAERNRFPAIYDQSDYVDAGGLMSYGGSLSGAYVQAGDYAARILRGAKPAELPVVQPTTYSLALNLRAARLLGIDVPQGIRLRADEVVE